MKTRKWYQGLSHRLKAARKDGTPKRFYKDFKEEIETERLGDISLKRMCEEICPDGRELVESFDPSTEGGFSVDLVEAPGGSQATTTSDFANITGQIVYSAMMREFDQNVFLHGSLVNSTPTMFDGEKIPGVSLLGDDTESIGEGDPYPYAKPSEEWIETPTTIKRGVLVDVTKEAIFFDRTSRVLKNASEVGRTIQFSKEKRILDLCLGLTNSYSYMGTAYDTYVDTPWDNVAASNGLVDYTDIENAMLLWDAMTDPVNGEPIQISGTAQLIVPTALLMTARKIITNTEVSTVDNQANAETFRMRHGNPLSGTGIEIVSSNYVKNRTSSATTWFLGDYKRAFTYMENWPMTVTQAGAGTEMEHTRDVVASFKVSERGVPAVIEPRYVIKCTA